MTKQMPTIEQSLAGMMRLGTNIAMTLLGMGLLLRYGLEVFDSKSQQSLRAELDSLGHYKPMEDGTWIQSMVGNAGLLESGTRVLLVAGICALLVLPSCRLLYSAHRLKAAHEFRLALISLVVFGLIVTGVFIANFSH